MTGRDVEMIAVGLLEGLDEDYLRYRMETTTYLFGRLRQRSVPLLRPAGGHAVYIDATRMLAHLGPDENPGQALAVELYTETGIRSTLIVLDPTRGPARYSIFTSGAYRATDLGAAFPQEKTHFATFASAE